MCFCRLQRVGGGEEEVRAVAMVAMSFAQSVGCQNLRTMTS